MPAKAGIHDFLCCGKDKPWIPAFAGMTGWAQRPWVNLFGAWYYTFIDPDRFEPMLPELRRFLHKLGRETRQGDVVCEFEGVLFKIRNYDR
jgi:hypothetical protein